MKIVEPNFSKNQNYLFRIHETFQSMKVYFTKIATYKYGKYISKILKKKGKEIFCMSLMKTFVVFDQSGHVILLTWYCGLYFFL